MIKLNIVQQSNKQPFVYLPLSLKAKKGDQVAFKEVKEQKDVYIITILRNDSDFKNVLTGGKE